LHNLSAKVRCSPGPNKATKRHNKSANEKNKADTASQTQCLEQRNMRVQRSGEDHTGILWVKPITGEANTKDAENEPGPVLEFEAAGKYVKHAT
jgi:hypothetical protein